MSVVSRRDVTSSTLFRSELTLKEINVIASFEIGLSLFELEIWKFGVDSPRSESFRRMKGMIILRGSRRDRRLIRGRLLSSRQTSNYVSPLIELSDRNVAWPDFRS